jgi:hypothetical protein
MAVANTKKVYDFKIKVLGFESFQGIRHQFGKYFKIKLLPTSDNKKMLENCSKNQNPPRPVA